MPYVNIRVAGKLTREQRQAIAKEVSETLERHAAKAKKTITITFDELPRENWAVGEELLG